MRHRASRGSILGCLSLALAGLVACAHESAERAAPTRKAPACTPSITVRTLDEHGKPLAGVTVYSRANAWVGPGGAFFRTGGWDEVHRSPRVLTDGDGRARICDPRDVVATLRAELEADAKAHPRLPFGGAGATQIGGAKRLLVVAERAGWPTAYAAVQSDVEVVLGPARSVLVTLADLPCRDSSHPSFFATQDPGDWRARAEGQRLSDNQVRFEGLGPQRHVLEVQGCSAAAQFLDGRLAEQTISFAGRKARIEARAHPNQVVTIAQSSDLRGEREPFRFVHEVRIDERGELTLDLPLEGAYCAYLCSDAGCESGHLEAGHTLYLPAHDLPYNHCGGRPERISTPP